MRKYEIKIELKDSIINREKNENKGMEEKACKQEKREDVAAVIEESKDIIKTTKTKHLDCTPSKVKKFKKFRESMMFVNMVKDHH